MKKRMVDIIFIIVLILLGIFLYTKYLGVKGLIVKEYRVNSEILSSNFDGIKIVHISDLLYGSTVDYSDIDRLVETVNLYKPDIIVFTGDISFNKKLNDEEIDYIANALSTMNASIGKYAVKGDYDYKLECYDELINKTDFILLSNSYDKIYYKDNNYIYIVGLPSISKDTIDLDTAFEFYSDENRKYTIVLLHEGNTIDKLNESDYEVDLILGGHSLNGSVIIPYYGSLIIPKESTSYYAPQYNKGITNIYISSGIGTLKYPYRFLNKPSINLYRLKSNQ